MLVFRADHLNDRGPGARGRRWVRSAVVLATIAGGLCLGSATEAEPDTRALKFHNVHTGERSVITYMRNGQLDPAGIEAMNRFLRDWRRNEAIKMDPRLFDVIWQAYQESGSKDYIHIISAYRSPTTNDMLRKRSRGVAKNSQHTHGRAMDFYLPDVPLSRLREIGLKMQAGGVGFYPSSGSPFVHLDVGSVRHWPRMTRQQLVRVFPNGGTLHVPSDGKPLPGYDKALAAYKARKANGHIAIADIGSILPSGASAGGPGIMPGMIAPPPRRRPGEEFAVAAVTPRPAGTILITEPEAVDLPYTEVEEDDDLINDTAGPVLAAANVPVPRPAPVTTRSQLFEPLTTASLEEVPDEAETDTAAPAMQLAATAPVPAEPQTAAPETAFSVAEAFDFVPLPRPAPVTTRANLIADEWSPEFQTPARPAAPSRPAVIVASAQPNAAEAAEMAAARARAIAAIRAQLLRGDSLPKPDPIGPAVMAFAPADLPAEVQSAPQPDMTMVTGSVPLPRARPAGITPWAPAQLVNRSVPLQDEASWTDPLAIMSYQKSDPAPLTRPGSIRQAHFAVLINPDTDELPAVLYTPPRALAVSFSGFVYDGLRTDRFTGRTIAPLAMVDLTGPGSAYVAARQ